MDQRAQERSEMVAQQLLVRGICDARVLAVMGRVPRHRFVRPQDQASAYADHPLPIGENQTISQPYMVATMSQSLSLCGHEHVLEVGTGSGYQTAVLAELAHEVVTVERIASLATQARLVLHELGYQNVQVYEGDGTIGLLDLAPYDAIVVTAGAPDIPKPLLAQLKIGGRLVIPIGNRLEQELTIVTRTTATQMRTEKKTPCRFVDLVGKHGWNA